VGNPSRKNHRCYPRHFFVCKKTTLLVGCNKTRRFARCAPINTARDAGESLHIRRPSKPCPQHPKSMIQKTKHAVRNHLKLVLSPRTFPNRQFEKKVPSRTQLGVHLGAFDMHITSRTGGSAVKDRSQRQTALRHRPQRNALWLHYLSRALAR
jgi:hypothetical protein